MEEDCVCSSERGSLGEMYKEEILTYFQFCYELSTA